MRIMLLAVMASAIVNMGNVEITKMEAVHRTTKIGTNVVKNLKTKSIDSESERETRVIEKILTEEILTEEILTEEILQ